MGSAQILELARLGERAASGPRWSPAVGLAGLVACGSALFLLVQMIGPDQLRDAVGAAGPLAPIVYVLLKASTIVVTPLSGTPLRLAAGTLFGFWEGVLLSVLGSALGGSASFWIARRLGRRVVARLLGPAALARVEPTLDRLADWRALALARLVLAPCWDVLSYGVGLTRLRFRTYLAVAVVGDVAPTMILVGVGTSIADLGMAGSGTAAAPAVPAISMALPSALVPVMLVVLIVLAATAVAVPLVAGVVLRTRLARRLADPTPAVVPERPSRDSSAG
jgi:uncharacterized membrane protein YdjX (TVP38/TMEM64 family)